MFAEGFELLNEVEVIRQQIDQKSEVIPKQHRARGGRDDRHGPLPAQVANAAHDHSSDLWHVPDKLIVDGQRGKVIKMNSYRA